MKFIKVLEEKHKELENLRRETNAATQERTLFAFHPHGILTSGFSLNGCWNKRFRELAGDRVVTSPGIRGIAAFWGAVRTRTHRFLHPSYQALQVPPFHQGLRVVDRRFVEAAHRHGLKVHVWTVDDPMEMRRLHALGVDGIMTDRPEVLLHTLEGLEPA